MPRLSSEKYDSTVLVWIVTPGVTGWRYWPMLADSIVPCEVVL